jgi:crotonobetainyl-CoA:carnitine CoA-transferase CaiB-like acyl-CoA transferase
MTEKQSPLDGVQVLDLTRVLAGPFATMLLADLGADVIKLERPGTGDDTRRFGPPFLDGESTYFLSINRGKRSVVVDLKSDEGVSAVRDLAAESDVLIENFRPGVLKRLGLGYDDLSATNQRLIYASISGFGHEGLEQYVNSPGYDLLIQSLSGVVSLTGDPNGMATKAGVSIGDLVGGLYAVHGVLAALYAREHTGRGQRIDVAMLDGLVSLLTYQAGSFLGTGKIPTRMGNRHPSICPFETFSAADGHMAICCGNDAQFKRLAKALDQADLASDPRFETNAGRVQQRDELIPILAGILGRHPVQFWIEKLSLPEFDVPCAPIQDVGEALAHPQLEARGMIREVDHPKLGKLPAIGCPIRMNGQSLFNERPAPLLGEHTEQIIGSISGSDS